jgi:hypothetical protein
MNQMMSGGIPNPFRNDQGEIIRLEADRAYPGLATIGLMEYGEKFNEINELVVSIDPEAFREYRDYWASVAEGSASPLNPVFDSNPFPRDEYARFIAASCETIIDFIEALSAIQRSFNQRGRELTREAHDAYMSAHPMSHLFGKPN